MRGTSARMSMTLARSARRLSMRRVSSYFSWNIQRLIEPSTRLRSGSNRIAIAVDASSVLKKKSPCSSGPTQRTSRP